MNLTGQNFIGNTKSAKGNKTFKAVNPENGKELETSFYEATVEEVDLATQKAEEAFGIYRTKSGKEKADFLDAVDNTLQLLPLDSRNDCHLSITQRRAHNDDCLRQREDSGETCPLEHA